MTYKQSESDQKVHLYLSREFIAIVLHPPEEEVEEEEEDEDDETGPRPPQPAAVRPKRIIKINIEDDDDYEDQELHRFP